MLRKGNYMSRKIVFQAWMFKLNNIPVEEIAKQGFTAIQTSPLQPLKEKSIVTWIMLGQYINLQDIQWGMI